MLKDCYVGVKAIVCVHDKCLLLKKKEGDLEYWDVPGGRIEDDETFEDALTREITEELPSLTQYTIGAVVSAHRLGHNLKDGKGLVFVFFKVDADDFEVVLTEDHSGYLWVDKENIKDLLSSHLSIEPKYYAAIERALTI